VSDRQLFFAIELSSLSRFDDLLAELTSRVLRDLGYVDHDVAEVAAAMRAELVKRAAAGSTSARVLQFSVHDSQLLMSLSDKPGREWRTTRPLP
jgi:hypothetical protein